MTKRRLWLALEILAISIPATWLWIEWGRELYPRLLQTVVPSVLPWVGLPALRPSLVPDRFVSYVPFLVLMVVTPRLGALRRVAGTVVGFALIFASHVAFVVYVLVLQHSETLSARPFPSIFPAFLLLDAFPILVWAVIARRFVSDLAVRLFHRPEARSRTGAGPD